MLLTDERKLCICLYKCTNGLPRTTMDEIMALIYHDCIWLPKSLLGPDFSPVSLSGGNLLCESGSQFLIFPFVKSKCLPYFETLLDRSYLISCLNFLFQLLLVLSRCLKITLVLNTWLHKSKLTFVSDIM